MSDTMRIMQDNKHYKAEKQGAFWDFVTRDPGDYKGKHSMDNYCGDDVVWMGCRVCRDALGLSDPPRRVVSDPQNLNYPSL